MTLFSSCSVDRRPRGMSLNFASILDWHKWITMLRELKKYDIVKSHWTTEDNEKWSSGEFFYLFSQSHQLDDRIATKFMTNDWDKIEMKEKKQNQYRPREKYLLSLKASNVILDFLFLFVDGIWLGSWINNFEMGKDKTKIRNEKFFKLFFFGKRNMSTFFCSKRKFKMKFLRLERQSAVSFHSVVLIFSSWQRRMKAIIPYFFELSFV